MRIFNLALAFLIAMPCFVVISISELAGAADARATYAHFDVEANLSNLGVSGLNVAKGLES